MPIYNNNALGQSFENIASMFAGPSSSDMANWSLAKERKQKTEQLAQLFANPNDPNFDRRNIVVGNYNPTQSFYAQDQNNTTAMRGQDISARTSIANNAADNQRAVVTNMFGTVAQDAMRPALPESVAGMYGLPALPEVQGNRSPLSATQFDAAQKQRLIDSGQLTDDALLAAITGDIPVEQTVGPNGEPIFTRRGDAVGKQAYVNRGAEAKGELYNYVTQDGGEGTALFDGQTLVDQSTGQPLPQGVKIYKAAAQGTADQIGMGTNSNRTDAQRLRAGVSNMNALVNELDTLVADNNATTGLAGDIMSFMQNSGQVVKELASTFGEGPVTPEAFAALTAQIDQQTGGQFNPAYAQARKMMLELAYASASMNNPSGEVSMQALAREVDALGQGMLGNDQGLLSVLEVVRSQMRRKLMQADVLDGRTPALTPDQIGGGGTQPAQPQTEADYNALPSGALFVDPEDGKTYRKP
jgi:hypothetical protein